MRIEAHHGNHIVCGHIYPTKEIKVGQTWQGSSGSQVTITRVHGEWVSYAWKEGSEHHKKDAFSFQCRYCLVLPKCGASSRTTKP
jgi:hypothetical protein